MEKEKAFLLWFDQLERKDVAIAGGKSSSLGELTSHVDVPVPYGFATTACAYRYFFEKTGLYEKIKALIAGLDVDNSAQLREVCAKVRQAIMDEEMPQDLQDLIAQAYKELGEKVGQADPFVAVRSSATAEDLPDASFAGQQDTYLNVKGAETIVAKVKECYASCFTDRAVYYREKQGFDHLDVALSAAVQMMVFSKAAGVMFTVNVATGDDKNILIEGAWGLGEYVVQGTVTPDNYTVNKATCEIVEKNVNAQDIKLIRKILRKSLEKANVDEGIIHFTNSLLKVILMFALFVVVIATCGVEISSFLAVLGSVSVAIGFAWQGSLSNLAGGLLILVLKPFHIGERIVDEKGNDGVVEEVDIFYTKIVTADQRVIVLPNGPLANGSITNYTRCPDHRIDIPVGISYDADIRKAREVLLDLLEHTDKILQEKDKQVIVDSLGDSSVNLIVRCFVKTEDFYERKAYLTENIKLTLDEAGISIPFPQMDVHLSEKV